MNENIVFKKVIGLNHVIIDFKKNISSRNNQTWMLIGKRGIGKRTLSMRLSAYIINNFSDGWENSQLTSEIFSKENDNLFYISPIVENKSGQITKDQIDTLFSKFKFFSNNLNKRVVIIDKLNWLTNSAMNSMLKMLEEPPNGLYFFLIVDELKNVLNTIQSRSQKLLINKLNREDCIEVLKQNNYKENDDKLNEIVNLSDFSPGIALELIALSAANLYQELLNTFIEKNKIQLLSKKLATASKKILSNLWLVEFFLKRLLILSSKYSIDKKLVEKKLIFNEAEVLNIINKNNDKNDILEFIDDLNSRLDRVKTFNLNLELEIFQFLNKFH
jgi:DNA polymerase III delta prime subunit